MRPVHRYPVDRYLVESSKNLEMVNIVSDDLWEPEPSLKPEDEIILRELHSMLRSTADDLKLLSGELSKYHKQEKEVHIKTQPTPLDEEFNEKIHIEEVVNAKFHNYKLIDKNPKDVNSKSVVDGFKTDTNNAGTQSNQVPPKKTFSKRLGITPTRIVQINQKADISKKKTTEDKLNSTKVVNAKPSVIYNEFRHDYVKPKPEKVSKQLQIQDMPSINIRSELREQKVVQLDIMPENIEQSENTVNGQINVAVVSAQHIETPKNPRTFTAKNYQLQHPTIPNHKPIRKVTKISTGDSSVSSNNISSETNEKQGKKPPLKISPKLSARTKSKKCTAKTDDKKKIHFNLDDWKKKLNSVYGQPSTSRNSKTSAKANSRKAHSHKSNLPTSAHKQETLLNNTEYIPYSKLTLGGVNVSDVERELSDFTNKDIPLSPILDKILSSHENTPRKQGKRDDPKVLTTSDENLLEEVLDIERVVSQTLSVNIRKESKTSEKSAENISIENSEDVEKDSYADDFEDEPSENMSQNSEQKMSGSSQDNNKNKKPSSKTRFKEPENKNSQSKLLNKTFTKTPSLSLKKSVDVFEFVHLVNMQDTATQSNTTNKISLKETQTSPKNERPNIHPIHNKLWPATDPLEDVEKKLQLEKDYIKRVILDEYGDLITKNLANPSTSQECKNIDVKTTQKITQTSPAHVKCVMTSPTRTKTRTTSPFISVKVDKDTSPMVFVTNDEELTLEVDIEKQDAISINLSSPRFSLRLPNTSREVLSNLDASANRETVAKKAECRTYRKQNVSSSSSVDDNYSSSELSSLGEVKLRKLLTKSRVPTISESSSSTSVSKYSWEEATGGILPLRSEGEVTNSLQMSKKKNNSKSEGEMSLRTK